jgi:hypothetical protein
MWVTLFAFRRKAVLWGFAFSFQFLVDPRILNFLESHRTEFRNETLMVGMSLTQTQKEKTWTSDQCR